MGYDLIGHFSYNLITEETLYLFTLLIIFILFNVCVGFVTVSLVKILIITHLKRILSIPKCDINIEHFGNRLLL